MKVKDLIEQLQQLDGDLLVVTPGFDESGYSPIDDVRTIKLVKVREEHGHYGMYEEARLDDSDTVEAIVIDW